MIFRLPKELDIDIIVKEIQETTEKRIQRYHVMYILSLPIRLATAKHIEKCKKQGRDPGLVHINRDEVERNGVRTFSEIRDYLLEKEIWIKGKNYSTYTNTSNAYAYSPSTNLLSLTDHNQEPCAFVNNLERKKSLNQLDYAHATAGLNSISIDLLGARLHNDELRRSKMKILEDRKSRITSKAELEKCRQQEDIIKHEWLLYDSIISNLASKQHTCLVDYFSGRLHTSLTSMPSSFMGYLLLEGEKMVGLDFVNCNPALSTLLFDSRFYKKTRRVKSGLASYLGVSQWLDDLNKRDEKSNKKYFGVDLRDRKELEEEIERIERGEGHGTRGFLSNMSADCVSKQKEKSIQGFNESFCNSDLYHFKNIVQGQDDRFEDLYQYLEEMTSNEVGFSYQDRKEVKKASCHALYHDPNIPKGGRNKELLGNFSRTFPNVSGFFNFFKDSSPHKNSYKILPRVLQSLEVILVIHRISKRLSEMGILHVTKHDNIICKESDLDRVRIVMDSESKKFMGITTPLKVKEERFESGSQSIFAPDKPIKTITHRVGKIFKVCA